MILVLCWYYLQCRFHMKFWLIFGLTENIETRNLELGEIRRKGIQELDGAKLMHTIEQCDAMECKILTKFVYAQSRLLQTLDLGEKHSHDTTSLRASSGQDAWQTSLWSQVAVITWHHCHKWHSLWVLLYLRGKTSHQIFASLELSSLANRNIRDRMPFDLHSNRPLVRHLIACD